MVAHDREVHHPPSWRARPVLLDGPTSPYDEAVRVSTRGDYACRALLSLALHAGEGMPTSVRDIAERTGLPQPYLEQILLALKGAGLVRSKRGVGGGYVLARAPHAITLGDIVSAVDGPITLGDFGQPHQDGACDHEGQCVLLAIWNVVGEHMRRHLDALTLADIAAMARGQQSWPETSDVEKTDIAAEEASL
jgi:Rrf2 family protein